MNGYEALEILKADPLTCHIPVIALSANAMTYDREKGLSAGFYEYLTKPLDVALFISVLNTLWRTPERLNTAAVNALPLSSALIEKNDSLALEVLH